METDIVMNLAKALLVICQLISIIFVSLYLTLQVLHLKQDDIIVRLKHLPELS